MRLSRFSLVLASLAVMFASFTERIDSVISRGIAWALNVIGPVSPAAFIESHDRLVLESGLRHEIDPSLFNRIRHESRARRTGVPRHV